MLTFSDKKQDLVTVLHESSRIEIILTAENITKMLKKSLYISFVVLKFSINWLIFQIIFIEELRTRMNYLEKNLSQILDIAHTWRAVLLIDEINVFLKQRELRDVNCNALVSIFLRMLKYF